MTLPINSIRIMFERELAALKREIEAYPDDASVWAIPPGISNSAGSLALHCAGNLQHFIGAKLGGTGYVRNREAEFARRDVSRAEIVAELDRAFRAVHDTLSVLPGDSVPDAFPERFTAGTIASEVFVLHLIAHLGYHLGQIDYHRRITTGNATTVNTVPVSELPALTA